MKQFLLLIAVVLTCQAKADNYLDMEPLKFEVPEMKAELVEVKAIPASAMNLATTANTWKPDFDFFKSKTNPGVKPYKFMDDLTLRATRRCSASTRRPSKVASRTPSS